MSPLTRTLALGLSRSAARNLLIAAITALPAIAVADLAKPGEVPASAEGSACDSLTAICRPALVLPPASFVVTPGPCARCAAALADECAEEYAKSHADARASAYHQSVRTRKTRPE